MGIDREQQLFFSELMAGIEQDGDGGVVFYWGKPS
jgi:hypothetical protein